MKSKILSVLATLSFASAGAMYTIGSNNSHLTELKDLFWVPIPLGIVLFLLAKKMRGN